MGVEDRETAGGEPVVPAGGALAGVDESGRPPTDDERDLWKAARAAAAHAYAPYSGFRVGALLRAPSGARFAGVNVENAASPVGLCAERVALGALVAAGERQVAAVAVAADDGRDALPCGACLQALAEFGDPLVVAQSRGAVRVWRLSELLRAPFRLVAGAEAADGHR